jgi:hypothetical protein
MYYYYIMLRYGINIINICKWYKAYTLCAGNRFGE